MSRPVITVSVTSFPANTTNTTSSDKSGRTLTLTTKDMQRKKNDVKARTTLLLSLPDEHQLRFKIEKDDLNQKFLTSLAPEWMMHILVWRNMSDLDTMSLDDLYNHLKVYESEVQKKPEAYSQNMAFISSAKHISGKEDGNTASVPTASTNVPTASASIANISQDTAYTYIASQSSDKFWEKTGKKISIQGSDIAGFDKSKITDLTDKLFDANNYIYHYKLALAQVESRLVEYKEREVTYIEKIRTLKYYNQSYKESNESLKKKLETLQQEKEGVDGKLAGLLTTSKDLDNLIESQRSEKNKEGLGYTAVPPPTTQLYLSPKKDLSWTGLPECADDIVTDYSRPSSTIESTSKNDQNRNTSVSETVASPITSKPFIKFVRPKDSQFDSKTNKKETPKKPPVKYAEQYKKPNMKPKARGNQRN
nr:hypothetical protein [Tanacetum cinerariifolium]GEZ43615.1 hypothetical protein [Tanacetum cinerariifolium]